MQGGVDRGEETVVGVEGEVNRDARARGHRAGDFNVEHHLAVGVGVRAGDVGAGAAVTGDADGGDPRLGQSQ